jgi:hypothetical protein
MKVLITKVTPGYVASICTPMQGQDTNDCSHHSHVPGQRENCGVEIKVLDDVSYEEAQLMVGRVFEVVGA